MESLRCYTADKNMQHILLVYLSSHFWVVCSWSQAIFSPTICTLLFAPFFFFAERSVCQVWRDVVTVRANVSNIQYILCPISPQLPFITPLSAASPAPMFSTRESFVFSMSAAMMWDNVGGQWSRQGEYWNIDPHPLPLSSCWSPFSLPM